jgi:hypothetical protein
MVRATWGRGRCQGVLTAIINKKVHLGPKRPPTNQGFPTLVCTPGVSSIQTTNSILSLVYIIYV